MSGSPLTEALLRHKGKLGGAQILGVNLPDPAAVRALRADPAARVTAFSLEYSLHRRAEAVAGDGLGALFGFDQAPPVGGHDAAVIALPRGREQQDVVLSLVPPLVRRGGPVWAVGSVRAGARSAQTLLVERIGPLTGRDAARRCVLYRLTREARRIPQPRLDDWEAGFATTALGTDVAVRSFPGVFSHGRLDPGTALLLSSLASETPAGDVLDWGCGCGVVGAALMKAWGRARVVLADSSALAIEASRRTLKANGLDERAVVPADVFAGAEGPFDLIVANPPFHEGEELDTGATEALIREAPGRLAPGGRLRLVANRFLRYAPLLRRSFGDVTVVAEDSFYKVYEATKPGRLARRVR